MQRVVIRVNLATFEAMLAAPLVEGGLALARPKDTTRELLRFLALKAAFKDNKGLVFSCGARLDAAWHLLMCATHTTLALHCVVASCALCCALCVQAARLPLLQMQRRLRRLRCSGLQLRSRGAHTARV